jgi:hypothetical protein
MNVKFLRRTKVVDPPAMTSFETKNYSQICPGGKTWRFPWRGHCICLRLRASIPRPQLEGRHDTANEIVAIQPVCQRLSHGHRRNRGVAGHRPVVFRSRINNAPLPPVRRTKAPS